MIDKVKTLYEKINTLDEYYAKIKSNYLYIYDCEDKDLKVRMRFYSDLKFGGVDTEVNKDENFDYIMSHIYNFLKSRFILGEKINKAKEMADKANTSLKYYTHTPSYKMAKKLKHDELIYKAFESFIEGYEL